MEGNRDEADRCIQIARSALHDGKYEKARKFATKADSLFSSSTAMELISAIDAAEAAAAASKPEQQTKKPDPSTASATNGSGSSTAGPRRRGFPSPERNYTAAQMELVRKINK